MELLGKLQIGLLDILLRGILADAEPWVGAQSVSLILWACPAPLAGRRDGSVCREALNFPEFRAGVQTRKAACPSCREKPFVPSCQMISWPVGPHLREVRSSPARSAAAPGSPRGRAMCVAKFKQQPQRSVCGCESDGLPADAATRIQRLGNAGRLLKSSMKPRFLDDHRLLRRLPGAGARMIARSRHRVRPVRRRGFSASWISRVQL